MANLVKPDLNKLRTEIDSRRKEKGGVLTEGTQSSGPTILPKDIFLNSLLKSLATGQNNSLTNNMKSLNERAEIVNNSIKKGVVTPEAINKIKELKNNAVSAPSYQPPYQPQSPTYNEMYQPPRMNEVVGMSPERDDRIFSDLETRRRNVTLAESIEGFNKEKVSAPAQQQIMYSNTGAPMLNEGYLVENVKKVVNNYLTENLGPIFEEAIKSTIIEMYAVERIKEVLQENKEMIKSLVYDTIREIQQKNKEAKSKGQ
jgi:hypothetical protein